MKNAYVSGEQKVIPAVLIYAFCGNEILMMARPSGNPNDVHAGKHNGLGGKHERGESPRQCAAREFEEEAGVLCAPERFNWIGALHFPNFKPLKNEDWSVTVFTLALTPEERQKIEHFPSTGEGNLQFILKGELLSLPLWEGDREFLPLVLAQTPFQGTFWYEEGLLKRFELNTVKGFDI